MTAPNPQAGQSAGTSFSGRIMQIRQMQADLQAKPVTGSSQWLKKLIYKTVRSAFGRQYDLNYAMVDLIEALHRETTRAGAEPWRPAAPAHQPAPAPANVSLTKDATFSSGEALASCGQVNDQAKQNNIRPLTGFNTVYTSPAEMRMPERVALYSLIFGMQPRNCLEIGTWRGGSSAIICGAMDDTGFGQLACVEPHPNIAPELWSQLSNRCRIFEGHSPAILEEVGRQIKTPFDFVLIDADHQYEAVRRDIAAVLPYLADNAYILFHDANHQDVKRAIDESVTTHHELTDCGMVSVEPTVLYQDGKNVTWAGLRLLKYQSRMARMKVA